MKKILILALAALSLAACSSPEGDAFLHGDGVLACANGTVVIRDRETGRLLYHTVSHHMVVGFLAPGVTPEGFCRGIQAQHMPT